MSIVFISKSLKATGVRWVIAGLSLLWMYPSMGQESSKTYQYNAGFTYLKGLIVPQYAHGLHLTYGRPSGFEVFWNQQTLGKKERERLFGYPQTGFSFTMIDTDMVETGKIFNAASYIDFYWLKTEDLKAYWRFGVGLTYATKLYDPVTNNTNNILSSPISYHAIVRIGLQIPVAKQFYINPAISWNHTSNGSLSLPNNGINIATLNVGAAYRFGEKEWAQEFEPATKEKDFGINLLVSGSVKETEPLGSPKRIYYTFRGYVDKTLSKVNRVYLGTELFNNHGLKDVIRNDPQVDNDTDFRRLGVFVGHELLVSRVSFMTMVGYYVYRPFRGGLDDDPDLYTRHGVKVYLTERLFTVAMMKIHGAQNDIYDFGIGVRL